MGFYFQQENNNNGLCNLMTASRVQSSIKTLSINNSFTTYSISRQILFRETDVMNRITHKMNDGLVHFTIRTYSISSDLANLMNFTIVRFAKTTVSPSGWLHNTHICTHKYGITIILIKYSFVSKTHTAGIITS